MKNALKLNINGSKSYQVVKASDYSRAVINDYNTQFVQLYDQNNELFSVDDYPPGTVFTQKTILEQGWSTVKCNWRSEGERIISSGKLIPVRAGFTKGSPTGRPLAHTFSDIHKNRLPPALKQPAKNWMRSAEHYVTEGLSDDLGICSEALVGSLDNFPDPTDDEAHSLFPTMTGYYNYCKGEPITEENYIKLYGLFLEKVLRHTEIQQSLI